MRTPLLERLAEHVRRRLNERRLDIPDPETGLPGRLRLRADLEASAGPRSLKLLALRAHEGSEYERVEADPELPRRIAATLVRAVRPLGARVYYVGGLMFAVVGPLETGQRVDLSVARQAMAGAAEELGASAVHGEAHMPLDGPGPTLLAVALRRMQARTRRQGSSVERQIRDVLLALLAERRAGGTPISLPKVGSHVVVVGRALGLSVEQLDETVRAAELQDVGKLVIPEVILTKRGALTDEEWRVIRTHPMIGARIIAAAPALSPVAKLVRASAERWDGSGYPDGLRGEAIPLGSRIIAVCVAFDAMTAVRPYREALPHAEAIGELRGMAGRQFDPTVVAAFCDAMQEPRSGDTPAPERPAVTPAPVRA